MYNCFGYDDSHLDICERMGLSESQYSRLRKSNLPRFEREMLYLSMLEGEDDEDDEENEVVNEENVDDDE